MKIAPIPIDEDERLAALLSYDVLDSSPEKVLDEITQLASAICGTKIALISLIDSNRQWFKSKIGLTVDETARDISFCGHAIMQDDIFEVEDAALDERFHDNPLFTGEPHVRFYAGAPLISNSGKKIGTICVIDSVKKKLSTEQKKLLKILSQHVMSLLELSVKNKELQDLKIQYEDVQKITQTGWWELDITSEKTRWSKEIYNIYQIDSNTITDKKKGLSYFPSNDQQKLQDYISESISTGKTFQDDFQLIDAKGIHKWVNSRGETKHDSKGKITKLVGTFADCTDRKKIELKLRKDTHELQAFKKGIDKYAIVSRSTPEGKITYVNQLFCDTSGYTQEELLDKDHRILNSGEHSKSFFENLWKTIKSGKSWRGEIRNKRKNGSFFWADTTIVPIFELSGKIKEFIAFKYEITDKKIAEQNLKSSHQYLDLALEGANLGIWDWNLINNDVRFDRRWCAMLGLKYEDTEMKLETWDSRVHPADKEKCYQDIKAYLEGKIPIYENIHRMQHHDGRWIYILDRGKISEVDHDGKPIRFTGTHFDLTEYKTIELQNQELLQKISKTNEQLEYVLNHSPVVVFECDINKNWTMNFISHHISIICGYPSSDFIHDEVRSYASIILTEDQQYVDDVVQKAVRDKTMYEIEYRIVHRSGTIHWVFEKRVFISKISKTAWYYYRHY
jgi:PAS domain S-box-containing protein